MPRRLTKAHRELVANCEHLIRLCDDRPTLGLASPEISAWSVQLHVEHLSRVDEYGTQLLRRFLERGRGSNEGSPNWAGRLVFFLRRIPRGRARVPKVLAPESIPLDVVRDRLHRVRQSYDELAPRLGEIHRMGGTETHAVLGELTARRWLHFALIHDRHHLKIIREICRDQRGRPILSR